jgi:hypothetical protein
MLQRLRTFLVFGLSVVSIPTAAVSEEEPDNAPSHSRSDEPMPGATDSVQAGPVVADPAPVGPAPVAIPAPVVPPPTAETKTEGAIGGWHVEVNGYFRAPMALGISSRPNPDEMGRLDPKDPEGKKTLPDGDRHTQVSYGPNRVIDWSYYSFAYTRLQEQDWAELTVHAKRKHVDAGIGWLGYWLAAAGSRNPDAAAVPGIAYLKLDTDLFELPGIIKPNLAFQMGAWWPGYGYFEKYDTFTLGRFRQIGAQLKLTVPIFPANLTVTLVQGFGTGRDGKYSYADANTSPLYANIVGADLIYYAHAQIAWSKYVDVGLHYNYEWTRDPYLVKEAGAGTGKSYSAASQAYLSVVGFEANLSAPYAGRLWISPSYLRVRNGWALGVYGGQGGTEVMHAQSGMGIAANYMQYNGDPPSSNGSGSMLNLGLHYEQSLYRIWSDVLGETPPSWIPDVRLGIFGLLADARLDLPGDSPITLKRITQFKYGADVTVQTFSWLAVMARFDTVNYDIDLPGYIFSAITGRLTICSHYLSGESIYIQYSKYVYGDRMVLAGKWPGPSAESGPRGGGWPLVAGTGITQGGKYEGTKPDEHVIKLQATIAF